MSNKKQSSIEWLVEQYEKSFTLEINKVMTGIIEQAKAMHKEEIKEAYDGVMFDDYGRMLNGEQYYKETFGGQDNE